MTKDDNGRREPSELRRQLHAWWAAILRSVSVSLFPFPLSIRVGEIFEILGQAALDPLDERAQQVTEALDRARHLLGDLQAEVSARAAIIENLAADTHQAEQRATQASARAGLVRSYGCLGT
jgi:hypothetical protein